MTLRVVAIDEIPEDTGLALDEPLDASWLKTALEGSGFEANASAEGPRGHVALRLDRQQGREVLLTGTARATLDTTCVRCLETLTVAVVAEFTLHLEPRPAVDPNAKLRDEAELTADELDVDYFDDDDIDVPHFVREQLLLEAPAYPRHEHDCALPGASTTAPPEGGGPRIDPRLAPLQKFLDPKKE